MKNIRRDFLRGGAVGALVIAAAAASRTPAKAARIHNSILVNDFGAIPDAGSTDNATAIQNAVNKCFNLGGGYVDFGVGNYGISSTLLMKNGVYLRGQGCGFDWTLIESNTTKVIPTVISWQGSSSGIMLQFPSGLTSTTNDAGTVDICFDGGEVTPDVNGITGIQILSCNNIKLRRTLIYRCSYGVSMGVSASHYLASAQHSWEDLCIEQCYDGFTFKGSNREFSISNITKANPAVVTATSNDFSNGETIYIGGVVGMTQVNGLRFTVAGKSGSTFQLSGINSTGYGTYTSGGTVIAQGDGGGTDCFGERIYIWNYTHYGFNFHKWCDTNGFSHVRCVSGSPNVSGIVINSEIPSFPLGCSGISFKDTLVEQTSSGSTIIVNNTDGVTGESGAFTFEGWYVGNPPVVQNGGTARIMNNYYAPQMISEVSIWTGGSLTCPNLASFSIVNNGAYGMFTPANIVKGTTQTPGTTQWDFWPVKIMWITFWNPGSAVGAIRLSNEAAGVISAPAAPGSAGFLKTSVDITTYCKANFTTNLATVFLESIGDGIGNPPTILKSVLEITSGV